ncbi:uncharacterized protein LOC131333549 [Rhododendron vialii]|uniref:uncharacterized protein LOC131333549 n=1 Tax=Rhododendron vialii TaxID=182163 RepID=UPI00265E3346|nr:uncharacterized protein LOC131333549 [Rhododendron vialii]
MHGRERARDWERERERKRRRRRHLHSPPPPVITMTAGLRRTTSFLHYNHHHLLLSASLHNQLEPPPPPPEYSTAVLTLSRAHSQPSSVAVPNRRQNHLVNRFAGREVEKTKQKCRTIRSSSTLLRKKLKTLVSVRIVAQINLSRLYFGSF